MKTSTLAIALIFPIFLSACASTPPVSAQKPPLSFHDSRLQYALVNDDRQILKQEFGMESPTGIAERIAAAVSLPFSVVADTLVWPASTAIQALTFEPPQRDGIRKKP
ncbi:MAG: hypothetical protein PHE55_03250 [Methylococcaceae bacterium]|nr:hypothetical protein [Methylococcaceae bacterium]